MECETATTMMTMHAPPRPLPSLAGRRILLVEPDPRALLVHFELLRELGALVAVAPGTLLALREALAAAPFDAVIVPTRAAELAGHALVDALREGQPALPALLCGGAPPGWPGIAAAPCLDLPEQPSLAEIVDALGDLFGADAAGIATLAAAAAPR